MILHALGGLANRLQAVMSRRHRGPMQVIWDLHEPALAGVSFGDLFEPLDGVTFVSAGVGADDTSFSVATDAPEGWEKGYLELRPKLSILDRIAEVRLRIGKTYAAMHVRRSSGFLENVAPMGGTTLDHEFFNFYVDTEPMAVFLATDNAETQRMYLEKCQRRIFLPREVKTGTERQGLGNHAIHTSVADAVVDLYVCAGATHFMGSRHSSFTDTINRLRSSR